MIYNKIIDIHAHIFPEKIAQKATESIAAFYGIPICAKGTIEDLLEQGKKVNIYRYVVHSTATTVEQVEAINEFISQVQLSDERFIGFGTLHPGLRNVQNELERLLSLGLRGIKLHPDFQHFNIDDEVMMPIYEAAEGRLPILMHMGDERSDSSSPRRLAKVLDRFPGLTVIAAHFGGYSMWDEALQYLVGRDLYFDTSSSLFTLDKSKAIEIIRKHGVKKILFGTDYPMWLHEEELKRFQSLNLTQEEQELILWKNAAELLNIK
ncbi:MAG: amidohydrolase [Thermoanaerobacteraceae bacterium]|nr:amidohydrolase [Thermoanaerobacteraceae bacterium]